MSSWLQCKCGGNIHKNLFCGTGMSVIATEEFLDLPREGMSADEFVDKLLSDASKLLRCYACGRIVILRETKGQIAATFFMPDQA